MILAETMDLTNGLTAGGVFGAIYFTVQVAIKAWERVESKRAACVLAGAKLKNDDRSHTDAMGGKACAVTVEREIAALTEAQRSHVLEEHENWTEQRKMNLTTMEAINRMAMAVETTVTILRERK